MQADKVTRPLSDRHGLYSDNIAVLAVVLGRLPGVHHGPKLPENAVANLATLWVRIPAVFVSQCGGGMRAIGWLVLVGLVLVLGTHPGVMAGLVLHALALLRGAGNELSRFVSSL
jgi:hypothetical protein